MGSGAITLGDCLDTSVMICGQCSLALADYVEQICVSDCPAITTMPKHARGLHLESYLERIADRDVPEADLHVRTPHTLI